MSADDFFDAPETPGRKSKWEQWGYHLFKDGLLKSNVDYLEPNKTEPSIIRVTGRPILDGGGKPTGEIMPFLRPRPSRQLSDPATKLFSPTVCYQVRCVRYVGPNPPKDSEGDRDGPPQLHFVDEWPPSMRRKYAEEGRQLPPTCTDILLAKAPSLVARFPAFGKYFKPDDDFHSALRRPANVWFLNGWCVNHGKVDCDANDPLPMIHLLTWTGYSSMMELIYKERESYLYPEDCTHELAGTRAELNKRFVVPDLTDPEGAPLLIFTSKKQKRKSEKGGKKGKGEMKGNRYEASLSSEIQPLLAAQQIKTWTPPEDIFQYLKPLEVFQLMLNSAGEEGWLNFLYHLAKGTDLEQAQSVPGMELADASVTLQAQAAEDDVPPPPTPATAPAAEYTADAATETQAAVVQPDAPQVLPPMGLGANAAKAPGEVQKEAVPAAATQSKMPLTEASAVFGNETAEPAGDMPESVEQRTAEAKAKLAKMRAQSGEQPAAAPAEAAPAPAEAATPPAQPAAAPAEAAPAPSQLAMPPAQAAPASAEAAPAPAPTAEEDFGGDDIPF